MPFGSQHDQMGYRRVQTSIRAPWSNRPEQTIYHFAPFLRNKGNRVTTIADSLTIVIGGDKLNKKSNKIKKSNRIKSTKYSIITFIPQNLLEQFRRIANFYFLVMGVIALVIDSPVSPLTSLAPLVFVIAVTATKQGYEDYLRHKADNMVNYSLVTVIRDGSEVDIKCEDIRQGDLVKVTRDCDVPCDLVLLKSSDINGKCHITTANLDGETNLKTLHVPKGLPKLEINKLHTLGIIECEQSQTDLYTFNGKLELANMYRMVPQLTDTTTDHNVLPLMAENLLLRGSRIKNTSWVIGCAVYTGQSTKLALNSRLTRNKVASSEAYINRFLKFILCLLIFVVTLCYFTKRYHDMFVLKYYTYLEPIDFTFQVSKFLQDYLSFLILFNYLIPISLYVTIEMHKFLGSFFMEWDPCLYDDETDQPCIVNTSDLNEELGQINILFSDKTGTLTKNEMHFQQCSIKGKKYKYGGTSIQDEDGGRLPIKINRFNNDHFAFFEALSLCHTVQVAGDVNGEDDGHVDEVVQNVYTFNNIVDDEHGNRTESDMDEVDFTKMTNKLNLNEVDNNPLLTKNNINTLISKPKFGSDLHTECLPKRVFADNRVHPQFDAIPPPASPVSSETETEAFNSVQNVSHMFRRQPNGRPISCELNRSISHIDQVDSGTKSWQTHRRTQSYGPPSAIQRQRENYMSKMTLSQLKRQESTASARESYAAPSFTAASLFYRKESVRRRDEIKSVVEKLDYQASSPDEKALVEACATLGFFFIGDENDEIEIIRSSPLTSSQFFNNKKFLYKRLQVLEFTSDRKRMSIIVRNCANEIWVYTKGAESHVFPLCANTRTSLINQTNKHITDFAKLGLRTLAVARRRLTEEEYKEISAELHKASNSLLDRKRLLDQCYTKVERRLELLGATAVEDALQDNVRDTLESLEAAGIRIWVLTGDKIETALNIALSCGHIREDSQKYFITECRTGGDIHQHLGVLEEELNRNTDKSYALLIDGRSLSLALKNHSRKFRDVTVRCKAVLCCRLSPLQKCEIVQLVKTSPEHYITAAIGDGANDVSMIQEAHVGMGIVGKEGRQAARCADFAFANFSMMKKVLLVHGHYYTNRLALLVLYFFYKNLVFMAIQFYFQFSNLFSAYSIYDSLFLTLYNVVYTAVPILFLSLTEKPYPENVLLKNPKLYLRNTNNRRLHWKYFLGWLFLAVYHSLVIYFFTFHIWSNNNAILTKAQTADYTCFGTFLIHNVVVIVNIKLWLEAAYQSYIFIVTILGSILAFILTTTVYNFLDIRYDGNVYMSYNTLLSSFMFWLLSILVIITSIIPDFTAKVCGRVLKIPQIKIFPGDRRKMNASNAQRQQEMEVESTNL